MARTSFGECYDNENYSHVLISYDTTPKAWLSNYHAIAYDEFQGLTNVRYFSNGVIIDNIRNLTLIHVQHSRSTTGRRDLLYFRWYLSFEISNNRRKNINSACLLVC